MVGAFSFNNPTCAYNHPRNLDQKSVPPLQLIFTSLFRPYLFIKSSLQSPLTLPSSIPQQFFTSLFFRTAIPTIYIKSISLPQPFSQFRLCQGANKKDSRARTDSALISLFFLKVWTGMTGITIPDSLLLSLGKLVYCK